MQLQSVFHSLIALHVHLFDCLILSLFSSTHMHTCPPNPSPSSLLPPYMEVLNLHRNGEVYLGMEGEEDKERWKSVIWVHFQLDQPLIFEKSQCVQIRSMCMCDFVEISHSRAGFFIINQTYELLLREQAVTLTGSTIKTEFTALLF